MNTMNNIHLKVRKLPLNNPIIYSLNLSEEFLWDSKNEFESTTLKDREQSVFESLKVCCKENF